MKAIDNHVKTILNRMKIAWKPTAQGPKIIGIHSHLCPESQSHLNSWSLGLGHHSHMNSWKAEYSSLSGNFGKRRHSRFSGNSKKSWSPETTKNSQVPANPGKNMMFEKKNKQWGIRKNRPHIRRLGCTFVVIWMPTFVVIYMTTFVLIPMNTFVVILMHTFKIIFTPLSKSCKSQSKSYRNPLI